MSSNKSVAALLLMSLWVSAATAAAVCPVRAGHPLRFVDVFDGPVEEMATLVPDRAGKTSGFWQLAYVYDASRIVTIRCKYADGEAVDVPLTAKVRGCSYRINARKVLKLDCR